MTTPSWKERLRPVELIVFAAIVSVFIGVVVALSTRELLLGAVFLGIAFIVTLVVLAMLALSVKPDGAERIDLDEQDRAGH